MFVKWLPEKHSTGIAGIDNQHQELFIIVNELHEIKTGKRQENDTIRLLKRLFHYTRYHFTSEEGLFKDYSYPQGEKHRQIHRSFTARIKGFIEDSHSGRHIDTGEVIDFLINWIVFHIQGEDKAYADFFRTNNIRVTGHFPTAEGAEGLSGSALELWNQKQLHLDLAEIDNQHRELVGILQQANDLNKTGISDQRQKIFTPLLIKKLFHYTQFHFSFEEELMAKNDFPELGRHRSQHKEFIQTIISMAEKYKKTKGGLTDEISLFLKDWTVNHIIAEDRKYKTFLGT